MRGFMPLFLLLSLSSIAKPSPTHLKDRPNYNAETRLERLEDFLEDREKDREKLFKKKRDTDPKGRIPPSGDLFEGDMIMDDDLRRAVLGEADKRDVLTADNKLWKNCVVPFVWAPNIAANSKHCLENAMKAFHKHTCISFVKRTNQKDYLYLRSSPNYCMSYVGKRGGKQNVHIGSHGCTRLGTCEHELLHALGMIHEQSRPDRDDHVTIQLDNIKESEIHNFNKYSYYRVSDEGTPYNFGSVMHYPGHAFAINRAYPTIVSKKDPDLIFGQRVQFSVGDVKQINRLYKCQKDKYSKDLIQTLSDEQIEEDLKSEENNEDYQPLIFSH